MSRYYPTFTSSSFAPGTNKGTWNSGSTSAYSLSRTKSGGFAATTATDAVTTANVKIVGTRLVSDPFKRNGQIPAGTLSWCLGHYETNAAADASLALHAYVCKPDATARGVVLNNYVESVEFGTSTTYPGVSGSVALTAADVAIDDRLVIELGAIFRNTVSTSYSARTQIGGTAATDLSAGAAGTSFPGWFDFPAAFDTLFTVQPDDVMLGMMAA